ncbi:MAG: ligase-associated DNA damage response DEXH box helicase [Bacteroidota bacterium]
MSSHQIFAADLEAALCRVGEWFAGQGWRPFSFQHEVWEAYLRGEGGLIHASTGTGKTFAAWMGPLIEALAEGDSGSDLRVIWVTPLRALANDTVQALRDAADSLGVEWRIEKRTSDTSSSLKARQKRELPSALVTTPESLTVLLSYFGLQERMTGVRAVVVDEWHELMGSKRGVQTELALARLRKLNPELRVWGLSATLGNIEEARNVLCGPGRRGRLVQGELPKAVRIDSLIPEEVDRFPWAGHLGLKMLPAVVSALSESRSVLLFTSTRSQTELWYRALIDARPELAGETALHHGSLDRKTRQWVEDSLGEGRLRCVVSTSSLDLGVDFSPVERVFQVGSPRGVARLLQRAGRSGHQPGAVSRVTCVPAHALELLEFAAARQAAECGDVESRPPVESPLDVLIQHVITIAMGSGFSPDELFEEVRTTFAYRNLDREEFDWAVGFAASGGTSLNAYDVYRRIVEVDGRYIAASDEAAQRHRMSIGTITSDAMITVKYRRGGSLGSVEESFISRLKPGDQFIFAGRTLELLRVRDMKAYVRLGKGGDGAVPRWLGGKMPMSTQLAGSLRALLHEIREGRATAPEVISLAPLLDLQQRWSTVPAPDELLIERTTSREGVHLFFFPFEGRMVHEGLAALISYRLTRFRPITLGISYNDYGFELIGTEDPPLSEALAEDLFSDRDLEGDLEASLNKSEMARRQFREIARVSGLVFQGYPGRSKSAAQLQASAGLIFDVFARHDPENLLLEQARREVLEQQLDEPRLRRALVRLQQARVTVIDTPRISPFAFPIYVDRIRERMSSEKLADRVRKLQLSLEKAAGG